MSRVPAVWVDDAVILPLVNLLIKFEKLLPQLGEYYVLGTREPFAEKLLVDWVVFGYE